jgi:hypothetical protein
VGQYDKLRDTVGAIIAAKQVEVADEVNSDGDDVLFFDGTQ